MARQNHIIESQVVELNCADDGTAIRVQRLMEGICKDYLWPALEQWLDSKIEPEQQLTFERLEVDLGNIPEKRMQRVLPERLIQALEKALSQAYADKTRTYDEGMNGGASVVVRDETLVSGEPVIGNDLQALLFYLTRGYLPWWVGREHFAMLETRLATPPAFARELSQFPGFSLQLLQLIRRDERAFHRLLYSFSPAFLRNIYDQLAFELTEEQQAQLKNVSLLLDGLADASWLSPGFFRRLSKLLLEIVRTDVLDICYAMLYDFLEAESQQAGFSFSDWVVKAERHLSRPEGRLHPSLLQKILMLIRAEAERRPNNDLAVSQQNASPAFSGIEEKPGKARPEPEPISNKQSRQTATKRAEELAEPAPDESIYIENAGLVLLHPFLSELFRSLEWVKDKEFTSPVHQQKAVVLLEYLANKSTQPPEFTLCLNKILCGAPLQYPVDVLALQLEEPERAAADELLTAVVGHWKALRGSSIDALRANFLMREGKLMRKDENWKLLLEKKPQDILLNHLPWGVSIIRLPWMTGSFYVDWA
ncbi:MAG: hypothetical protein KDD02_06760 [Phaeodactylibacter sp.]|nr:hypothetical protein [Phaeodactylibacter sp.]